MGIHVSKPSKFSLKISHSFASVFKSGSHICFSHALTVRWSTPISFAKSLCEKKRYLQR